MQQQPGRLRQLVGTVVMRLGIVVFTLSALGSVGILMEGVTRRVGEGTVVPPESPEQSRSRLVVIAALVGTAVVGWIVARLGDFYRQPDTRPRVVRLAAELLLLLGGIGLALALLIGWGHHLAAYEVAVDYRRVGDMAQIGGPALLILGWWLVRWDGYKPAPEKPANPER